MKFSSFTQILKSSQLRLYYKYMYHYTENSGHIEIVGKWKHRQEANAARRKTPIEIVGGISDGNRMQLQIGRAHV